MDKVLSGNEREENDLRESRIAESTLRRLHAMKVVREVHPGLSLPFPLRRNLGSQTLQREPS